jgi:hypothetical protein
VKTNGQSSIGKTFVFSRLQDRIDEGYRSVVKYRVVVTEDELGFIQMNNVARRVFDDTSVLANHNRTG